MSKYKSVPSEMCAIIDSIDIKRPVARVKVFELCQQAGINPVYLPELDEVEENE